MIAGAVFDGTTVIGNRITGSGAREIYVASPKKPNEGKQVISGNIVSSDGPALFLDPAFHSGPVLAGKK